MTESERRRQPRVIVALQTVVESDLDLDGTDALMSNLSLGGCCVFSKQVRRLGEKLEVKFELGEGFGSVSAEGIVRWSRQADSPPNGLRWSFGIQFTEIAAHDLGALKAFVEAKIEENLFVMK